jgi:FKBP-type peptidyl-prolyl cis-trans isomerase FklB
MKGLKLIAVLFFAATVSLNAQKNLDSLSYSLGVLIYGSIQPLMLDNLSTDDLAKGIADAMKNSAKIDMPTAQKFYGKAQAAATEKQKKVSEEKGKVNIEKGKKFLEENKKKKGVITLPSGLQYEIMTAGTGAKPGPTDKVKTHYHGTLMDGTVFDSSVQRGEPIEFPVNGVIKGWTEALQLMPTGSKWKLYIPYDLAYGDRGAGGSIGPYETLIFEVELLAVTPAAAEHGPGDGHNH